MLSIGVSNQIDASFIQEDYTEAQRLLQDITGRTDISEEEQRIALVRAITVNQDILKMRSYKKGILKMYYLSEVAELPLLDMSLIPSGDGSYMYYSEE